MNITESQALMRFVDLLTDPPKDDDQREVAAGEAVDGLVFLIGRASDSLQVTTSPVPFLRAVAASSNGWFGAFRWAARQAAPSQTQEVTR